MKHLYGYNVCIPVLCCALTAATSDLYSLTEIGEEQPTSPMMPHRTAQPEIYPIISPTRRSDICCCCHVSAVHVGRRLLSCECSTSRGEGKELRNIFVENLRKVSMTSVSSMGTCGMPFSSFLISTQNLFLDNKYIR